MLQDKTARLACLRYSVMQEITMKDTLTIRIPGVLRDELERISEAGSQPVLSAETRRCNNNPVT